MSYHIRGLVKNRAQGAGYRLEIRQLTVRRGEAVAITGPSGCGKSTTLDILGLVLRPDRADSFTFAPADQPYDIMAQWNRQDTLTALRLHHIGYVLQTGGLLPFLSVQDNMTLTARMNLMEGEAIRERLHMLSNRLGIGHLLRAMPSTLSVGERQRVAIVRALLPQPHVVLADEPTAALDPVHAGEVLDIFIDTVKNQRSALILVTHDRTYTAGLREAAFRMEQAEDGSVRAVLDDGSGDGPKAMERPS